MNADLFLKNATAFFLVFVRVLSMLAVAPVFGNRSIPMRLRILLALVLAGTTFPFVSAAPVITPARKVLSWAFDGLRAGGR